MAERRRLGGVSIALANLRRQGMRTGVMEFLCLMRAASLFVSSILLSSMERSVDQTVNRMGADVIVVPKSYACQYAGSVASDEHRCFDFGGCRLGFILKRNLEIAAFFFPRRSQLLALRLSRLYM